MLAGRSSRRRALRSLVGLGLSGPFAARADEYAASPQRDALLARAEAELRRGDTAAALDDFERAALIVHAPDAEMGSIRAAMQSGQYRRALAFCAHTAGEHLEAAEAGALYAWLLRAGGQPVLADRVLAETLARSAGAGVDVAIAVRDAFSAALPAATGVLLAPPQRMAPWPTMRAGQPPLPGATRLAVSGGVLIADGRRAVVLRAALPNASDARLWVRNGLGETTEAVRTAGVDPALSMAGVAVLTLRATLDAGAPPPTPDVPEPFAGSAGSAVCFAPAGHAAWPWLTQGFFAGVDRATGLRRLGFDVGDTGGAAVLDGVGRLAGIVVGAAADRSALWLPATRWRSALSATGIDRPAGRLPGAGSLTAPDTLYEAGLRLALQLIVEAPAR